MRIGTAILFVALAAGTATADPRVEVEGRYWFTDLDARARSGTGTGSAFEFDLPNDLGVGDENFGEIRATFRVPATSLRFRLDYTPMNYSGDRTVTRSVSFGGQTYTSGTRIQTNMDIHYARAAATWQFVNVPFSDFIKFGPMIEAKGFWIKNSLSASGAQNVSRDYMLALPTVGLALDANPIDELNIFAEFSGLPAGKYGHFVDAEAGIRYQPVPLLSLVAGYRFFDIEANDEPDYGKFQVKGPFAGAALRF